MEDKTLHEYKQLLFGVKRKKNVGEKSFSDVSEPRASRTVRILPATFNKRPKLDGSEVVECGAGICNIIPGDANDKGLELFVGENLTFKKPNKRERKRLARSNLNLADKTTPNDEKKQLSADEVRHIRNLNRIFTWGSDVPDPVLEFSELSLPNALIENLSVFNEPTPIQMQSIPISLKRRDLLATAPTGSGKTLAFGLPVVMHALEVVDQQRTIQQQDKASYNLVAIILSPTKVLAKQTYDEFEKFCKNLPLKCDLLKKSINPECNIIITTPNRLVFLLRDLSDVERSKLLHNLKWLVVDECDRIFDTTEGDACFRNQIDEIFDLTRSFACIRGLYSATFSYVVEEWCKKNLSNFVTVCIGPRNSAITSVKQELIFAGFEQAKTSVVRDLIKRNFDPPMLIFVQSKDRAKQLYAELHTTLPAIPIGLASGELPIEECNQLLESFRSGKVHVLVCTELIGRGLDFENVNLVINFDLPTSIASYIHRIGRTGRAGREGKAITLFTKSDFEIVRPIATVISQAGYPVPEYLLRLKKVTKKTKKDMQKRPPKRKNLVFQWRRVKKRTEDRLNEDIIDKSKMRERPKSVRKSTKDTTNGNNKRFRRNFGDSQQKQSTKSVVLSEKPAENEGEWTVIVAKGRRMKQKAINKKKMAC